MRIYNTKKQGRLHLSDLNKTRAKMYIGQKAIVHEKDAIWTDNMVKVPVIVCALNEHTFTVKRKDMYGGVIKESFKYVDLFMKDSGIEVVW